jgi:hypothetical protein
MRVIARSAYRFFLMLHPHEFRAEFGDEMLWIFDEQMRRNCQRVAHVFLCAQLLSDVFRSAFIQRTLREREQQQPSTCGPHFYAGSSGSASQIAQGSFVVFSCLFSLFSIVLFLRMVISNL